MGGEAAAIANTNTVMIGNYFTRSSPKLRGIASLLGSSVLTGTDYRFEHPSLLCWVYVSSLSQVRTLLGCICSGSFSCRKSGKQGWPLTPAPEAGREGATAGTRSCWSKHTTLPEEPLEPSRCPESASKEGKRCKSCFLL